VEVVKRLLGNLLQEPENDKFRYFFTSSDDCWSYVKRGKQVMGCFGSMVSQILFQFAFADMR
jgi:hypothetical protein